MSLPGTRLRALAARVCSEKTMERLIDPVIGDLQVEYASAIGTRGRWLALLTGYIAFAKVSVWCGLLGLREARRNWNAEDAQGLLHTVYRSGCAIVIVSVPLWLMQLPMTLDLLAAASANNIHPSASVQRLMFYLVPAILPLSVPVGLGVGAALVAPGHRPSRRLTSAILLVALAASLASLVTLAWVTPATNQSYREAIIGRTIPKGDRELTLIELRRSLAASDQESARRVVIEFHQRLSFALTPVTFAAFGLVVAIRRRPRMMAALGSVGLVAFGYFVVMWLARGLNGDAVFPTYLGPWMPQIALMLTAAFVALPFLNKGHPNTRVS